MVAGYGTVPRGRIAEGPEPEHIDVEYFTENYLSLYSVTPRLGRGFSREDMDPGAPLVALLGYGYWQRRFGGQEDVIGKTIRLDTDVATIVGVLPAWFGASTPVVTPMRIPVKDISRRGTGRDSIDARLRSGITIAQARERLTAKMSGLPLPRARIREVRAAVTSTIDSVTDRYRTTVNVLAGAVALILLIAAVNVSGLLLARGTARQSEFAIRAALGAERTRLIRQLLTESAVLAIPATAIGVFLAWMSLDAIVANLPLTAPDNSPIRINLTVLALTCAVLVPTTLLFGLAPAIRLSGDRIGAVLARGSRQVGASLSRRGSQLLIAAEVALAVVLVAGAGLMIRSLMRIAAVDLGFSTDRILTMQVLALDRDPAAHKVYYTELVRRLRTMPGIASAGLVNNFALRGGTSYTGVVVDGKRIGTTVFEVLPGYFETIGATLQEGRLMTDADISSGYRGVVLNEHAARLFFGNGSALGRQLTLMGPNELPWTVIGVIGDLRHRGPLIQRRLDQTLQVFFPLDPGANDLNRAMTIVTRQSGDWAGAAERLRETASSIGPRVIVEEIRSADELFATTIATPRRRAVLLGLLGALGLTLALVGVFGMTAYAVTRRTSEIGVRIAFGARPDQVVRTILRDAALPIAIGTLIGVAGATLATRVIESFLFETAPGDPITLTIVALTLAVTGCLAALVPALRAARVDPALSLRAE